MKMSFFKTNLIAWLFSFILGPLYLIFYSQNMGQHLPKIILAAAACIVFEITSAIMFVRVIFPAVFAIFMPIYGQSAPARCGN